MCVCVWSLRTPLSIDGFVPSLSSASFYNSSHESAFFHGQIDLDLPQRPPPHAAGKFFTRFIFYFILIYCLVMKFCAAETESAVQAPVTSELTV